MTRSSVAAHALNFVSRETLERLEIFQALLLKWNSKINLVSKATIHDFWTRHVADSAQLWHHRPETAEHWVDLGSGGGFPGLVLAIMAREFLPDMVFTLVDSDARKCAFLAEVSRSCDISPKIMARRIDNLGIPSADVVSARALAPVPDLLAMAEPLLDASGVCLFPKGVKYRSELENARASWQFDLEEVQSLTDGQARLLIFRNIRRA